MVYLSIVKKMSENMYKKKIDGLKGRIVKLENKVEDLNHENSCLREMLSVNRSATLSNENRDLIRKLSNELVRKWRIEDEMLL